MKELKTYAHLYLGCQAILTDGDQADRKFWLNAYNLNYYRDYMSDVKLILRPLSDMTEEEAREIWDSTMPNTGYRHNHKDRLLCSTHTIVTSAVVIPVLLSRGFDLFGLIVAGLAVSKTETK